MTVKTTAGPAEPARPKLRGTTEAFASRLFGSHVTKTNALESLVTASFVRGLPTRDVEAAPAGALGEQAAISKSTVSVICGQLKGRIRRPGPAPPGRHRAGLPAPGRLLLPDAPGLRGQAGAGRLGHHHRRQARVHRPAPRHRRVDQEHGRRDGTDHRRVGGGRGPAGR
ncbi:MAG: transposase [Streptosporangiaceae bacterium]